MGELKCLEKQKNNAEKTRKNSASPIMSVIRDRKLNHKVSQVALVVTDLLS
jgi:hypothetical protein